MRVTQRTGVLEIRFLDLTFQSGRGLLLTGLILFETLSRSCIDGIGLLERGQSLIESHLSIIHLQIITGTRGCLDAFRQDDA